MSGRQRDPGQTRAVLRRRARELASVPAPERGEGGRALVVLAIGDERYGIDMEHLLVVLELGSVARVPGTSPAWAGLTNVRGTIHPVLDLRTALRLPRAEGAGSARIVVLVAVSGMTVGLAVDEVTGIEVVDLADVHPAVSPDVFAGDDVAVGLTTGGVAILDVAALLEEPHVVLREETA